MDTYMGRRLERAPSRWQVLLRICTAVSILAVNAACTVVIDAPSTTPPRSAGAPSPADSPKEKPAAPATSASKRTSEPSPTVQRQGTKGSDVDFDHFKVKVNRFDDRSSPRVRAHVSVCVTSLPPDPQGDRTRISWDPWSIRTGSALIAAQPSGKATEDMLPRDGLYRVDECAVGWISFLATDRVETVDYANGVGDHAVWKARQLDDPPSTGARSDQSDARGASIGAGTYIVGEDISPGRYKARADEGGNCYWARLMDDSGEFDSIIANGNTAGRASVTIKPGDGAFETSGCTPWVKQ